MSYKMVYSRTWIICGDNGMESESATIEGDFDETMPLQDAFGKLKTDMESARANYIKESETKAAEKVLNDNRKTWEAERAKLETDLVRYNEFCVQADIDREASTKQSYMSKIGAAKKRLEELNGLLSRLKI